MKFSKDTVEAYEKNLQAKKDAAEKPLTKQYLNPNEVEIGSEVNFALLEEDPLEFWEVWGQNIETDKYRPFRFPGEAGEPTDEEIHEELGGNWVRQKTEFENLRKGIKKGDPRPAVKCMAWPVFNFDEDCVQVLSVKQPSLRETLMTVANRSKYRNKMVKFNHSISKTGQKFAPYAWDVIERDDDFDNEPMNNQWALIQEKGFNLQLLLTNGDPFNPERES